MIYPVETGYIKDVVPTMVKRLLGVLYLRKIIDQHQEITVMLQLKDKAARMVAL